MAPFAEVGKEGKGNFCFGTFTDYAQCCFAEEIRSAVEERGLENRTEADIVALRANLIAAKH